MLMSGLKKCPTYLPPLLSLCAALEAHDERVCTGHHFQLILHLFTVLRFVDYVATRQVELQQWMKVFSTFKTLPRKRTSYKQMKSVFNLFK